MRDSAARLSCEMRAPLKLYAAVSRRAETAIQCGHKREALQSFQFSDKSCQLSIEMMGNVFSWPGDLNIGKCELLDML